MCCICRLEEEAVWVTSWQNQQNDFCAQWRLRSAWASAQSDQSLCCGLNGYLRTQFCFRRTALSLIRLGGWPGWSESSLGAQIILLVLSCRGSIFILKLLKKPLRMALLRICIGIINLVLALFPNHTPLTAWLARWFSIVLMLPNAYSHCLFTVTVSDMKSRSAHAFMCDDDDDADMCVCVCVCVWSGWFLLQSPEMKLAFLLQFISRWKTFTSYVIGAKPWCGAKSASANNVLCLLTFAWRWSRIAMTLSAGVPPPWLSQDLR